MTKNYLWTNNPTEANVAVFDPDILNECLMHLKYSDSKLTRFCINSASTDSSGNANLLGYLGTTLKFNCGTSLVPVMNSNTQDTWSLSASHSINTSSNDIYKSFDGNYTGYCSLAHTPSAEEPAYIKITNSSVFTFDYLYLKFDSIYDSGTMKNFYIKDNNDNVLFSYDNYNSSLDKDTFLIPIYNFGGTSISIYTTSNVNNSAYTNFPAIIKLLDKSQVISATNAQGENVLLSEISNSTISADGTYYVYLGTDGAVETSTLALTYGKTLPSSPTSGQIHYLTSTEPAKAKKYNGSLWLDFYKIPVGKIVVSGSTITSVTTNPYNQNSYIINVNTTSTNAGNIVTKDVATSLCIPSHSQVFATANGYTATKDGIWSVSCNNGGNSTVNVYVNGVYMYAINAYGVSTGGNFLLAKGDYISVDRNFVSARFIPMKGAL